MKNIQLISISFCAGLAGALVIALLNPISTPSAQHMLVPQVYGENSMNVDAIDVSDVVARVNPAVVSIVITEEVPVMEQYFEDPFEDFFGGGFGSRFQIPRYRQNGTEEKETGGGSGFLISSDGYLVTNAHVIRDDSADYTVFFTDESEHTAEVVAKDEILDVALLKIDIEDAPHLSFADSDNVRLGEAVVAIGNALGEYRNTVSTGVVSGLSRSIVAGDGFSYSERLENVIQTDAAINPGNSGGPLLNLEGEVVGVNVAVARGSENIGFSLPANAIEASVNSMKAHGRVIRPYLGVRYIQVNENIVEKNNLSVDYGVLILRGESREELAVLPGSPADKAGLEEFDIILEIDGIKLDSETSLASLIRKKTVGETIELLIMHDGKEQALTVELEEPPQND